MAKRTKPRERVTPRDELAKINSMFRSQERPEKHRKAINAYAVKMRRGPEEHEPLIIRATDHLDAMRQWFNYYNLALQTYRYVLACVMVPPGNELEAKAIECQHPRVDEDVDLNELAAQQYEDVQSVLGSS